MRKFGTWFGRLMFCTLLTASLLLAGATQAASYCTSQGYSAYYEWIDSVSVGFAANLSGSNGGYGDYTGQTIELFLGPNPITLSPGFKSSLYTEYWRVWIDLNQDGDFSSDEIVYSGVSSGTLNGDIDIDQSALGGVTRMRVSMR